MLFGGLFVFTVLFPEGILLDVPTFLMGFFVILFFSVAVLITLLTSFHVFCLLKSKLILSSKGLLVDSYWQKAETPWSNVERIGVVPIMGSAPTEAFLLRQPPTITFRWLKVNVVLMDRYALPLTAFGRTWGDDPLAQAINHFAPHLIRAPE